MKRLFIKNNKYKAIDSLINDCDLVFGIALIIKEIQVHLLQKKMRNNSYIIQADITNDVWSYADTHYTIKKGMPGQKGFIITLKIMTDIMWHTYSLKTHSMTGLMFLRRQVNVALNIS